MRLYVYLLGIMMCMSAWATEKVMSTETKASAKQFNSTHQVDNELEGLTNIELQELFAKSKQHAEQGQVDAQYNLGAMYDQGQGVEQDYVQAAKWYEKAAEQGQVDAQDMLE